MSIATVRRLESTEGRAVADDAWLIRRRLDGAHRSDGEAFVGQTRMDALGFNDLGDAGGQLRNFCQESGGNR
jgi:hypothetical protein